MTDPSVAAQRCMFSLRGNTKYFIVELFGPRTRPRSIKCHRTSDRFENNNIYGMSSQNYSITETSVATFVIVLCIEVYYNIVTQKQKKIHHTVTSSREYCFIDILLVIKRLDLFLN